MGTARMPRWGNVGREKTTPRPSPSLRSLRPRVAERKGMGGKLASTRLGRLSPPPSLRAEGSIRSGSGLPLTLALPGTLLGLAPIGLRLRVRRRPHTGLPPKTASPAWWHFADRHRPFATILRLLLRLRFLELPWRHIAHILEFKQQLSTSNQSTQDQCANSLTNNRCVL